MPNPTKQSGYRLSVDGAAFFLDYQWKTAQAFRVTIYDPEDDVPANVDGLPGSFEIWTAAGGTLLDEGTLSDVDAPNGLLELALGADSLGSLTWYIGERTKVLRAVLSLRDADGARLYAADDQGTVLVPFRVHWGPP